ncbi:uncharacterized protein LOC34623820 [Cyclospora cayetanensis]|uniref:Uncharacterized protein LOC34623820 n=1 Tax=Cyclospora cayetanensis TaxID=88456 RepID=A0A6P6S370_9EIME|nr:uncharacterized protein LOC34623820 [Cyclospora cayetanensis]
MVLLSEALVEVESAPGKAVSPFSPALPCTDRGSLQLNDDQEKKHELFARLDVPVASYILGKASPVHRVLDLREALDLLQLPLEAPRQRLPLRASRQVALWNGSEDEFLFASASADEKSPDEQEGGLTGTEAASMQSLEEGGARVSLQELFEEVAALRAKRHKARQQQQQQGDSGKAVQLYFDPRPPPSAHLLARVSESHKPVPAVGAGEDYLSDSGEAATAVEGSASVERLMQQYYVSLMREVDQAAKAFAHAHTAGPLSAADDPADGSPQELSAWHSPPPPPPPSLLSSTPYYFDPFSPDQPLLEGPRRNQQLGGGAAGAGVGGGEDALLPSSGSAAAGVSGVATSVGSNAASAAAAALRTTTHPMLSAAAEKVRGVAFCKSNRYWICTRVEHGKQQCRYFSVKHLGFECARREAILLRQQWKGDVNEEVLKALEEEKAAMDLSHALPGTEGAQPSRKEKLGKNGLACLARSAALGATSAGSAAETRTPIRAAAFVQRALAGWLPACCYKQLQREHSACRFSVSGSPVLAATDPSRARVHPMHAALRRGRTRTLHACGTAIGGHDSCVAPCETGTMKRRRDGMSRPLLVDRSGAMPRPPPDFDFASDSDFLTENEEDREEEALAMNAALLAETISRYFRCSRFGFRRGFKLSVFTLLLNAPRAAGMRAFLAIKEIKRRRRAVQRGELFSPIDTSPQVERPPSLEASDSLDRRASLSSLAELRY